MWMCGGGCGCGYGSLAVHRYLMFLLYMVGRDVNVNVVVAVVVG